MKYAMRRFARRNINIVDFATSVMISVNILKKLFVKDYNLHHMCVTTAITEINVFLRSVSIQLKWLKKIMKDY